MMTLSQEHDSIRHKLEKMNPDNYTRRQLERRLREIEKLQDEFRPVRYTTKRGQTYTGRTKP